MGNKKDIFDTNMKMAGSAAEKWNIIFSQYRELSCLPGHQRYEELYRYLYERMKDLAKEDLHLGGIYLLQLARAGTIKELISNSPLCSLRSAASTCLNELFCETSDRYLALLLGIGFYEASIPMPIGFAHGRDAAVKYIRIAQAGLNKCTNTPVKERITNFVINIQQYEEIKKDYESAKWKGCQKDMRACLKQLEQFYEPVKEDPHYDFILRELVTWYSHMEMFTAQYKASLACIERYPGDESLSPLLQLADKRRLSVKTVLRNLPLFLLCATAVLVLPILGALFTITFFQSFIGAVIVFVVLLVIRIFMIKGSGENGIDGSVLDFMEGFFWGRM